MTRECACVRRERCAATLRRWRGDEPLEARVAAQWIPERVDAKKEDGHIRRDRQQVREAPNGSVGLADQHLDVGVVLLQVGPVDRVTGHREDLDRTRPLAERFGFAPHLCVRDCQVGLAVLVSAAAGVLPAAMAELAPWRVRCTVLSVSYNVGVALLGGTTPLVAAWLVSRSGFTLAPAVYLAVAGGLSFVGALLLPKNLPHRLTTEFQTVRSSQARAATS